MNLKHIFFHDDIMQDNILYNNFYGIDISHFQKNILIPFFFLQSLFSFNSVLRHIIQSQKHTDIPDAK